MTTFPIVWISSPQVERQFETLWIFVFFVQPTEECLNGFPDSRNGLRIKVICSLASLLFFLGSPFDGLDGSVGLIVLVASLQFPIVTASVYLVSEDLLVKKIRHAFALEDLQVILGCWWQCDLAWMREMSFPSIAYHVKLYSMIVQVLGGTVSLVGNIPGDLTCTVPSAACDYRHRVNNDGILLTVRRLEHAQQLWGQFRNSTDNPI